MTRPVPHLRAAYPYLHPTPTRWADNDVYGHVNALHTALSRTRGVNTYLARAGVLDPQHGSVIGLVVETGCAFFAPASFPEMLAVGVRVAHLGQSSVRYELAVFREGEDAACAQGHFVHVYVDRESRRPTPLPAELRGVLGELRTGGEA